MKGAPSQSESGDSNEVENELIEQLRQWGCDVGRSKKGRLLRVNNRPCSEPLPSELLQQLLACTALKELYIRGADEFMLAHASELASLPKLTVLDVEGSDFDDESIRHFKKCLTLQVINVRGTKVTESVVAELRKLMINSRIIY